MQIALESAHVLHRRSYRESSLLLELFSARHGRIGAVARGAARGSTQIMSQLQPFQPLLVSWSCRRSELVTLTHSEVSERTVPLAGESVLFGFYLNELIVHALPRNDAHPELYCQYADALRILAGSGADHAHEVALRVFEKHLLDAIGYGINLDHIVDANNAIDPDSRYVYLPGHGAVSMQHGDEAGEGVTVHGRTLLGLSQCVLEDEQVRQEAKRLMRALLRAHLGDRPLFSRTWFGEF